MEGCESHFVPMLGLLHSGMFRVNYSIVLCRDLPEEVILCDSLNSEVEELLQLQTNKKKIRKFFALLLL